MRSKEQSVRLIGERKLMGRDQALAAQVYEPGLLAAFLPDPAGDGVQHHSLLQDGRERPQPLRRSLTMVSEKLP